MLRVPPSETSVKISTTVSQDFIRHAREILRLCLNDVKTGGGRRQGINGFSFHALPTYVCAVAAVEAFVNETLLSQLPEMLIKDSALWSLPREWREKRIEIGVKLVLLPQLLFGKTFARDTQPYQDMDLLIKVRNDLIHYKMSGRIPNYLKPLEDRGIALRDKGTTKETRAISPWPHKLTCTEGVRWAHNTACNTVRALFDFGTDGWKEVNQPLLENFTPIPEADIIKWYEEEGIDPFSA